MHQEAGWDWDKAQIARKRVSYHRCLFENIDRIGVRPGLNRNRCLRLHNIVSRNEVRVDNWATAHYT